jgi:hypothetical protein
MARFRLPYVLTLSLSTLALGAAGCSNSHSPTEPAFDLEAAPKLSVSPAGDEGMAQEGDAAIDKRRGRGGDDPAGDDRGGRGRGGDDRNGDDRGRRGRGRDDRPANPQQPRAGQEFEGSVASVNGQSLTLAGGSRVTVNGQTQWSARGDLFTLRQVAGSVAAGRPTRVEGRGVRQADGSFLAQTIKAEVDD